MADSSKNSRGISCRFIGVFLDFDGTIVDSTDAVIENWKRVSREIGANYETVLQTSHGRRSIDVLKILNPKNANWDYVRSMESRIPSLSVQGHAEIPGARSLLHVLNANRVPYAIVTSGTRTLLSKWTEVLTLPEANRTIVAEDVQLGKPDPEGYNAAKMLLAEDIDAAPAAMRESAADSEFLVIEDSPAGIQAGKAAGCRVLAVTTTHSRAEVAAAGADWIVEDLRSVTVSERSRDGRYTFDINSLL